MDLNQLVADSLEADAESKRQKKLANQLSRQVKRAVFDRAMALALEMPDSEYVPIAGIPSKIIASWNDQRGSHRIVYTRLGEIKSITDTPGRPSKRPTSSWKLRDVPLVQVPTLFAPLMKAEFGLARV